MANSPGAKQPRQSDFDHSDFKQPPRGTPEPQRPIDLLIPNRIAEEKVAETKTPETVVEEKQPVPKVSQAPAPPEVNEENVEPPKEKVSAMIPAALHERVMNVAFWERLTIANLVERGLNVVLAELERKHGGPYEKRTGDLPTGRPAGVKSRQSPQQPGIKRGFGKR